MTKTTKLTKTLIVTAISALALGLSACGGETPQDQATPAVSVDPGQNETSATETPTGEPTAEATDPATSEAPTQDAGEPTGEAVPNDLTAAAIEAIRTAEAEVGGVAYEIDDIDDDGTWEIDVWVENRSIEVEVSADGLTVVKTDDDDDMDSDDRAALESAQVDIVAAIETAVEHAGGVLDEAELDDEDGRWVWDISVRGHGSVDVDIQTGEIVG